MAEATYRSGGFYHLAANDTVSEDIMVRGLSAGPTTACTISDSGGATVLMILQPGETITFCGAGKRFPEGIEATGTTLSIILA